MGGGSWTRDSFATYTSCTKGATLAYDGSIDKDFTAQEMFTARKLDPVLDPKGVMRECCDSEEHPNTVPVILALDVTGSMGDTAVEVAKKLNVVMTELYEKVNDVEFLIMGIGDLYCDSYPIQASQFESDIRIAEQLDKIYFEGGGGGNEFESYTSAWYFGLRHTKLDCWNRGKRGIIITSGDEPLNPYLLYKGGMRSDGLSGVLGDSLQDNIETSDLYYEAVKKFDIYHLAVDDHTSYEYYEPKIKESYSQYLDEDHLKVVNLNTIVPTIIDIITKSAAESSKGSVNYDPETGMISW